MKRSSLLSQEEKRRETYCSSWTIKLTEKEKKNRATSPTKHELCVLSISLVLFSFLLSCFLILEKWLWTECVPKNLVFHCSLPEFPASVHLHCGNPRRREVGRDQSSEGTVITICRRASLMWKEGEVFGQIKQRRKWICCGKILTKNCPRGEARVLGTSSAEMVERRNRLC